MSATAILAISMFAVRFPAFFLNARYRPKPLPVNPHAIVAAYTVVIASLLALVKTSVGSLPIGDQMKNKKKVSFFVNLPRRKKPTKKITIILFCYDVLPEILIKLLELVAPGYGWKIGRKLD